MENGLNDGARNCNAKKDKPKLKKREEDIGIRRKEKGDRKIEKKRVREKV